MEVIQSPEIGSVVRHAGWKREHDKNYPCDVLITGGQYRSKGRISNFWSWQRVLPDGSLADTEEGYGDFRKIKKNTNNDTHKKRIKQS